MDACNLVVVRGKVTSAPVVRALPSGDVVTNLEVTSRSDTLTASVPVVVDGEIQRVVSGDELLIIGHVRRRFFRSGGVTQSRTEVVASSVVPTRQRKRIEATLAAAVATLSEHPTG